MLRFVITGEIKRTLKEKLDQELGFESFKKDGFVSSVALSTYTKNKIHKIIRKMHPVFSLDIAFSEIHFCLLQLLNIKI